MGLALCVATASCVRQAVLENQLSLAQDRERALAQSSDLNVAEAALSAHLIELEALLHQRGQYREQQLFELLHRGYTLLARGFIEARRLDAVAAGDSARAEAEGRLLANAEARAREYRRLAGQGLDDRSSEPTPPHELLRRAEATCRTKDAAGYERELTALLARAANSPDERLRLALAQRLAAAWLMPAVAARCGFNTPAAPKTTAPVPG